MSALESSVFVFHDFPFFLSWIRVTGRYISSIWQAWKRVQVKKSGRLDYMYTKSQKREPHRGMFGSIGPVQQIPLTCKRAVVEPAQMDGSMVKKSKLNVSKHGTRNNNSSLRNERFQIDACTRYVYMCKKTHEHDCLSQSCFSTACAGCTQHCAELTLTLLLLKLVIFKIE